jgi:ectoine hydroxylase-related dioxygenase (phytanoyl-CoA dioxygenase family)
VTTPTESRGAPAASYPDVTQGLAELDDRIRKAGLERNVLDLEVYGYTVVPSALPPSSVTALSEILQRLAVEDDNALALTTSTGDERWADRMQEVPLLLTRGGPEYEALALHPKVAVLLDYLLGTSRILSSLTGYVKGTGGGTRLGIHSDTAYVPDPLPPYAQLANVNYCLTQYTQDAGCLRVVPGSHRYCHRPRNGQSDDESVPVETSPGSAIVFHGNTWHGAYPRQLPGQRLAISALFCRSYMRSQERYDLIAGPDLLSRNPPELRRLVGVELPTGWTSVADFERIRLQRRSRAGTYYRTRATHV